MKEKKKYELIYNSYTNAPPLTIDKPCLYAGRNIPEQLILDINNSGVYFGLETENGKGYYVGKRSADDGNVLIAGINGSGKSYVCAKSIIETWREPFVALDCKGELALHYYSLLRNNQTPKEPIIFNPSSGGSAHYDPFAILRKDDIYFSENVKEIAYALIPELLNDPNQYWRDMARYLLIATILLGFSIGLDFIDTMIMAVTSSASELCKKINQSGLETAKMFINDIATLKDEHLAAIGTDMRQHIMVFATDPCIQDVLSRSDTKRTFSWEDIVTTPDAPNVFLQLSQDRLEQWSGMTRLMLTQIIRTLERRPDKHSYQGRDTKPILLLLDEFPLLGKMDAITNALTTLRSKKVTFCLMIQSIAQLDAIYGHEIRKIIVDNCQYKVFLIITEPDSQEYFSRLISSVPTARRGISINYDPYMDHSTYGQQIQEFREPWILPHEFAFNQDLWLHTPYGFFATVKLPVSTTHKHVLEFERAIEYYIKRRQKNDC